MARQWRWRSTQSRVEGNRAERFFRNTLATGMADPEHRRQVLAVCEHNYRVGFAGWWGCEVVAAADESNRYGLERHRPVPPVFTRAFENS